MCWRFGKFFSLHKFISKTLLCLGQCDIQWMTGDVYTITAFKLCKTYWLQQNIGCFRLLCIWGFRTHITHVYVYMWLFYTLCVYESFPLINHLTFEKAGIRFSLMSFQWTSIWITWFNKNLTLTNLYSFWSIWTSIRQKKTSHWFFCKMIWWNERKKTFYV